MKRTKIQNIILPRNWLFGRLSFIVSNLNNPIIVNKKHFSKEELRNLLKAKKFINKVLINKNLQSKLIKDKIKTKV